VSGFHARAARVFDLCAEHETVQANRVFAAIRAIPGAYALRCLEALGIQDTDEGIIRISMVHYNTEEEVSRLVDGLKEAL
jgi:selenocysteine lyase/cysteine desulfurase